MILIIENFLEQIVITVTDELSHCGAVSTVKTTPQTATNKCFQPLTIGSVRKSPPSNSLWLLDKNGVEVQSHMCR